MSAQTSKALSSTCRSLAAIIEDLLDEGYDYVLTARFTTDFLERRFSRYRQMSGGRFLVSLREVCNSEKIISLLSLLKVGINVWEEDLSDDTINSGLDALSAEVSKMDFNDVTLSAQSMKVCAHIGGYIVKELLEKKKPACSSCKSSLLHHGNELHTEYLNLLSRGGLRTPSLELLQYASSLFGILELIDPLVRKYNVGERFACEHLLKKYGPTPEFMCVNEEHNKLAARVAIRIVINIYYNNSQKESKDSKRKESVTGMKARQRKKPE